MRLSCCFGIVVSLAFATTAAATPTRTIFHSGTVFTGDPAHPWAQAVAVEGKKITAVGTNAQVLAQIKPNTRQIDLGGRLVIPGLNDAHVHVVVPEGAYLNSPAFLPGPGPTLAEVQGTLAGAASAIPAGTWLFMFIGSNIFDDPAATRFALDPVSPNHPVALFAWTGHGTWLNSKAMETLGISTTEPDPFGGRYERVAGTNVLTGVAHEYAEFQIRRKLLSALPDAALVAQYRAFAADAVRLGYTSLQDMAVGLTRERSLNVLRDADLPLRVRSICFPLGLSESCEVSNDDCDDDNDDQSSLLRATGVKWITDGTPIERLAFVTTPYADRPSEVGAINFSPVPLKAIVQQQRNGPASQNQLLFHSVGDGAIDRVFDALEQTGGASTWKHRRTRIEHGDLLFSPDYARARQLGVVVVQNATHLALTSVLAQRFVPSVFSQLEPLQTLLAENIPLALGTDAIGRAQSPFVDLFLATIHPTHPSEALTLEQALSAYTRGSAYAEFQENKKGVLAVGKAADLAVLSQDIFHVPPPAIPGTVSLLTMVGGKIVWDAGALP